MEISQRCPFCKYNKAKIINQKIDIKYGYNYLRNINDDNSFLNWLEEVKLVECKRCKTIHTSPKINRNLLEGIYSKSKSSHDMGWNAIERSQVASITEHDFYKYIYNLVNKEIEQKNKNQDTRIIKVGEFGCPFSGYAMAKLWAENKPLKLRYNDKPGSYQGKIFAFLNNIIYLVITIIWKLRDKRNKRVKSTKNTLLNIKKTFITEYSYVFWLGNCARYGKSCINLAKEFLFDEMASLNSILQSDEMFDLLIIANSIDHYLNGFEIIKSICKTTKNLIILNHSDDNFSAQHLFSMKMETMYWIGEEITKKYPLCQFETFNFHVKKTPFSGIIIRNLA